MSSYVAPGYVASGYYTDQIVDGISINWMTFVLTISQSYLTPLGGIRYDLDIEKLRNDLKNIEDSEDGIAFSPTHNRNAPTTLSGVTYVQSLEMLAPYTITFENTGTPYTVLPSGANHNLADVTNFDGGMSMIVGNSAGLQSVNTGGGGGATASEIWTYGTRTLTSSFPSVPSAADNAAATIAALIEGGLTLQDVLRIVLAVTSGDATGLEGASMAFKSVDGTKDRVLATYATGTRNVTALDPT